MAGNELLPALDNHATGTIFEELIRRFSEENNEEAGEHFTPPDVVKLMADLVFLLVFLPVADDIESGTYLVYDGAGGMLTVVEEHLAELARNHGKEVVIHLYGQEVQPETYAISKADMLLKGEGVEAENMLLRSMPTSLGLGDNRQGRHNFLAIGGKLSGTKQLDAPPAQPFKQAFERGSILLAALLSQ